MRVRSALSLALLLAASCSQAAPRKVGRTMRVQWVFKHFDGAPVRLAVDGRVMVDRVMRVDPDNGRNGVAATAFVDMPGCSAISLSAGKRQLEEHLCLAPGTKSITVDGAAALTLVQANEYWGAD